MIAKPILWTALLMAGACKNDANGPDVSVNPFACSPVQPAPYANGIPYLGVHADAGNSDVVGCQTADNFEQGFHALKGLGLAQPNTFSPDGSITYATTTHPDPSGCRLWAIHTQTGETSWCQSFPPSIGQGSVEVDERGDLYFAVDDEMVSLDAQGTQRWRTAFSSGGEADAAWGLHFTPDGHIATVTRSGVVHLLDRDHGEVLSSLSIGEQWSFVPPVTLDLSGELSLTSLLPEAVQADVLEVWGEETQDDQGSGVAGFLGAGGFVDNTLGIDPSGRLYIIGGGPDEDHGALVQVRVGGSTEAPVLTPGWAAVTSGGSATSPSISADGGCSRRATITRMVVTSRSSSTRRFEAIMFITAWIVSWG